MIKTAKKPKFEMFKPDISGRRPQFYRSPILKGSTNLVAASRNEKVKQYARELFFYLILPTFNQLHKSNSEKEFKVKIRYLNSFYLEIISEPYLIHACCPFSELSLTSDALNRMTESENYQGFLVEKKNGFWIFSKCKEAVSNSD